MAIKGAKTIAEYAFRHWMEQSNFATECFALEVDGREGILRDSNGDTLKLVYDPATKMVIAVDGR